MENRLLRACTCSLLLMAGFLAATASGLPHADEHAVRSARSASLPTALVERLIERSQPLRATPAGTQQRLRLDGLKAPASLHAIVIMVDFADSCFYGRQDEFDGPLPTSTQSNFYYAAHDSVYYEHLVRDVADYYDAVSGGRFQLHYDVHGRISGLDEGMAFYGDHPEFGEQPVRLAADAIAAFDAEIDFSLYDTVILIHAGAGQETDILNDSPEQIYSTYLGADAFARAVEDSILTEPYIATIDFPEGDGVRHVLILPETQFQDPYDGFSGHFGSLGTYCFVVGLRLGMLSLSDFTPPGAPDSQGVGQFCLMGYGLFAAGGYVPPHPCAFNKQFMGWLEPYLVDPDLGATWTLHPSASPEHPLAAARIDLTGSEYYLLEYRLQDPDGNRIFSFAGDLNGNNVPDFYDMSNVAGGGIPTRFFNPEEDVRERMVGAEWDFFLSDNPARAPEVKGAGSGVYVWHIDEGVIRDVFGLRQNLFNADPRRKSVDLVEADGIQDLDSRQPSPYWLGGDDDSFRGEGNSDFGPDTRPATRTNGGLRTGLIIDQISNVVVDSAYTFNAGTDSAYVGILHAETMTFRCRREPDPDAPVGFLAARDLPGVDMTASHLLVAALGGESDPEPVFVAAADSGRVYAWTADLRAWGAGDDDPDSFSPLAVGTDASGQPVTWLLPAAAGRLDPDSPGLQIVLAAAGGLYAFAQDGAPLASGPGETDHGLIAALALSLPPVLLPLGADEEPTAAVVACVVGGGSDGETDPSRLHFLDHQGGEVRPAVTLPGVATAPPVHAGRVLYVPVVTGPEQAALVAVSWPVAGDPAELWLAPLDIQPGVQPPLVAPPAILVTAADGSGQTVLDRGPDGGRAQPVWPRALTGSGPLGPGGAYVGHDALGRLAPSGTVWTGWPRRPQPAVQASLAQPLGLGSGQGGSQAIPAHHLFATRDGRLFLMDQDGEVLPGWPLAGPADLHATPALVTLDPGGADERLVLMVAATTPQISGLVVDDPDAGPVLQTEPVARLRAWQLIAPGSVLRVPEPGAMYGGSPWRGQAPTSLPDQPQEARLAANHVCYPQPLTGDLLRVRGQVPREGAARAVILNLQGEPVRDTGTVPVLGGAPFELEVDMRGVASGLYVCRLEAGGQTSVRTIAVTR